MKTLFWSILAFSLALPALAQNRSYNCSGRDQFFSAVEAANPGANLIASNENSMIDCSNACKGECSSWYYCIDYNYCVGIWFDASGVSGGAGTGSGGSVDADGKYCGLIFSYGCPEDIASYGPFTDSGRWGGGSDCGLTGLPAGYYVYFTDTWYVYDRTCGTAGGGGGGGSGSGGTADANGKYCGLIGSYGCPEDIASYGPFTDSGRWGGGSDCGLTGLPAGYYVYFLDTWYIYNEPC